MKTIVIAVLLVSLAAPDILWATTANELRQPTSGDASSAALPPPANKGIEYSPRAAKTYLSTGIGTLVAGGVIISLGKHTAREDNIGSEAAARVLYVIGGSFLAASTILWILYFREMGREPATTLGVDLVNGRYSVVANFRY